MPLLRPRPCRLSLRATHRTFSTTTSRPVSLQIDRNDPEAVADTVPAYPYGPARWYKQSNKGLYGGQRIQSGNNVSGHFNTKTRRTFQVNVFTKRLWSSALDRFVQIRVSARTLRTIDRVGGLDEYLLGDKEARIKQLGVSGWWLRWAIMQQPSVKGRFRRERIDLGLAEKENQQQRNVGAELETAYAALPDEGEVEAVQAAAEQDLASDEASAIIQADDVFAVETPPDLPPLKFRVGKRAHVVLTPKGWVRTKPFRPEYTKQWIANNRHPNYVSDRMAKFEAELAATKESMPDMSLQEEKEILTAARREYTRELNATVDAVFEEQMFRTEERRKIKQQQRAARMKGEVEMVEEESREPDALDRAQVA